MKNLICYIGIHQYEISGHVTESEELIGRINGRPRKRKVYKYNYHRECQACGKVQKLVRPKEYHPTKYIWEDSNIFN